jgi:chromate reductase, NAD(P)H dehydrogenase (quinone)
MIEQKILSFAGSLRAGSYNRLLLRAAAEEAPEEMTIEIFDLAPIPLYNEDLEVGDGPEPVARLKEAIARADGVLITTPEYQHGISGVLKNTLDWASRPWASRPAGRSVLRGKPVATMGASPSPVGTARAQMQLREILAYLQADAVAVPEVLVAHADSKFDDEGRFTDETGRRFMRQLLENLARAVATSGAGISPVQP